MLIAVNTFAGSDIQCGSAATSVSITYGSSCLAITCHNQLTETCPLTVLEASSTLKSSYYVALANYVSPCVGDPSSIVLLPADGVCHSYSTVSALATINSDGTSNVTVATDTSCLNSVSYVVNTTAPDSCQYPIGIYYVTVAKSSSTSIRLTGLFLFIVMFSLLLSL